MLAEIDNLSYKFGIHGVSAHLPEGEVIGIVGPDGAGKTTLMRLMAGLFLPMQGSIKILGYDSVRETDKIHALMGYMPQKFGLYEELTVMQNLSLYADLRGLAKGERAEMFERLLGLTKLTPFTKRVVRHLSGGMKQKLGLSCALIQRPKILLLDEPGVGVDPLSRRDLWDLIALLLKEGTSTVVTTSYLEEAEKCDRVVVLNKGKLLFAGRPSEFAAGKSFEEAFARALGGDKPRSIVRPDSAKVEEVAIEAEGLTKSFGSFTAVDGVSFSVKRGEVFGLLGPNGAGKTTIFKMLCGLLKPTLGSAKIGGLDFQKAKGLARQQLGYMGQKCTLYGMLSVRQNLTFFAGVYGVYEKERIERQLRLFELESYAETLADELPLGYKQRLGMAAATIHEPKVLFLDEPTSGVDPLTRREFWGHIQGFVAKGLAVLVTTHFMDEAEYCDRLALIYGGKAVYEGTPSRLKEETGKPTLEEAFVELIEKVST